MSQLVADVQAEQRGLAIVPSYLATRLQRSASVPELRRDVWVVVHRDTRKNARVRRSSTSRAR